MNRLSFLPKTRSGWALGLILTAILFWIYYFPVLPSLTPARSSLYERIQRAYYDSYLFSQQYQRIYQGYSLQIETQTPKYISRSISREMVIRINNLVEELDRNRKLFELDVIIVAETITGSPDQPAIQQVILPIQSEREYSEFNSTGTNIVRLGEIPVRAIIIEQVWLRASQEISEGMPVFLTFFVQEPESVTPRRLTPVSGETNCDMITEELKERGYDTDDLSVSYRIQEKTCLLVDTDKTIQQVVVQTILLPPWANGFLVVIALLLVWLFEWVWDIGVSKLALMRKASRAFAGLVWLILCVVWAWALTELFVWIINDTGEALNYYILAGLFSFPISILIFSLLMHRIHNSFRTNGLLARTVARAQAAPQSLYSGLKHITGKLWAAVQVIMRYLQNWFQEFRASNPLEERPDAADNNGPNGNIASAGSQVIETSNENDEEKPVQNNIELRIKSRIEQCKEKITELHQAGDVPESRLAEFWKLLKDCRPQTGSLLDRFDDKQRRQLIELYESLIGKDLRFDQWFVYKELLYLPEDKDDQFLEILAKIAKSWKGKNVKDEEFRYLLNYPWEEEFISMSKRGLDVHISDSPLKTRLASIAEKRGTKKVQEQLAKAEGGGVE